MANASPHPEQPTGRFRVRSILIPIGVVALLAVGFLVGAQFTGGFQHLAGGTTEVATEVVGVEETEKTCHKTGETNDDHVSVTHAWTESGDRRTTERAYCTSSPPALGDEVTLWIDDDNEVVSTISPKVGRYAALGIDLVLFVVVGGLVLLRRRTARQE